jgi:S1-C subfamily serine protease
MKCRFRYLLPLLAVPLLLDVSPSLSVPANVVAQLKSESPINSSDVYAIANPAVVTIYAGRQIGSGSIVSSDGLVITNQHVVRRVDSGPVEVKTSTGKTYYAKVVASDRLNDLALLQLDTSERFRTIRFSGAEGVRVGDKVYAIGSPFGRVGVMTTGTLSSIHRNGDLQSKLVLNPGNSGGPLLNSQGELIGINKGILESEQGENMGISFSTSMTVAKKFIEQHRPGSISTAIAQHPLPSVQPPTAITQPYPVNGAPGIATSQPFEFPPRIVQSQQQSVSPSDVVVQTIPVPTAPDLGQFLPEVGKVPPALAIRPKSSGARLGVILDTHNLTVQVVQPGSPAAMAGLRMGDRLLAINGDPLRSFNELQAFLNRQPNGAVLTVRRNARPTNVSIRF